MSFFSPAMCPIFGILWPLGVSVDIAIWRLRSTDLPCRTRAISSVGSTSLKGLFGALWGVCLSSELKNMCIFSFLCRDLLYKMYKLKKNLYEIFFSDKIVTLPKFSGFFWSLSDRFFLPALLLNSCFAITSVSNCSCCFS